MKKFFAVLLALIGIGAVAYVMTQRQAEVRRLWDEVLEKVPAPGCCDDCAKE